MDLVVVDRVAQPYVEDVAALLADSGLHPRYDNLRRLIVHNNIPTSQAHVAIYVPADEADAARQILAAYHEESHAIFDERMQKLPPVGKVFLLPGLGSFGLGVLVAIANRDPIMGLGVWLVSFILIIKAMSWWRSRSQKQDKG